MYKRVFEFRYEHPWGGCNDYRIIATSRADAERKIQARADAGKISQALADSIVGACIEVEDCGDDFEDLD